MTKETTNAGKLGRLAKLAAALTANNGDLPNLQGSIGQFAALVAQAQDAAKQQAARTAEKQEASRLLSTTMSDVERLGTVLQLAVKQHYGIRAEKLAEFGLQPFRGRKTAKAAPTPTPPPTSTPTPTPAPKPLVPAPAATAVKPTE